MTSASASIDGVIFAIRVRIATVGLLRNGTVSRDLRRSPLRTVLS